MKRLRRAVNLRVTGMSVFLLFFVFCSGCAVHVKTDRMAGGYRWQAGSEETRGVDNFSLLQKKYGREWQLNHGDRNMPPALGLAMSGGGMRSAAFNVGVLQGLYEAGVLQRVDVMSSVSGGGYALSWYYLQRYNSGATDSELFDPGGRFMKHLEENGRILTHSKSPAIRSCEYLVKVGANLVSLPFHWFANGLFDWNLNLAPYRMFYQNAIEREFHLTPEKSGAGYVNDARFMGITVGVNKEVGFPQMREFIKKEGMPSFIINTTVKITDSMDHYSADFKNAIFEFTPFAFGSDSFGYRGDNFPVDIHTAVAISGAAADSSIMPAKLGFMFSALNTDLGYNIPNHNIGDRGKVLRHDILPAPFYFFYRDNDDIRGTSIYLTDGGHSDNLGAFSLVRRLCRRIIIIDAEHDPEYRFLAYHKLKDRLRAELGVEFSLPEIDRGLLLASVPGESLLRDDRLAAPLIRRLGLSRAAFARYDAGSRAWIISDPGSGRVLTARRGEGGIDIYKKYDGSTPVMRGRISWFPLVRDNVPERIDLEVVYVKLSLDPARLDAYPQSVRSYFRRRPGFLSRMTGGASFPHEDTSDISYDPLQFAAYRDLGRYLVSGYFIPRPADNP